MYYKSQPVKGNPVTTPKLCDLEIFSMIVYNLRGKAWVQRCVRAAFFLWMTSINTLAISTVRGPFLQKFVVVRVNELLLYFKSA